MGKRKRVEDRHGNTQKPESPLFPVGIDWPVLLDWSKVVSLVLGGCCSNAWALEQLLKASTSIGTTLTMFQMGFVAFQGLPSFLLISKGFPFLRFKPRTVPINQWGLQVVVLWTMSLLNNLALAYSVPVPLLIVFRSGGLGISMFFGRFFLGRHYNHGQVGAIILATLGVILTTVSRSTKGGKEGNISEEAGSYVVGIVLLTISSILTGYLGLLQERTYSRYGRCWQEGLFYTHFLSLPLFLPFTKTIFNGIITLQQYSAKTSSHFLTLTLPVYLLSQLSCVSGVGMLTTRVSNVSTNLFLTARKALSLIISVVLMGSSWNLGMSIGSGMVFLGGIWYGVATQSGQVPVTKSKAE